MSSYFVKASKFVLPGYVASEGYLEVVDGLFGEVVAEVPEGAEVLDYSGCWVAPGYVDTHIHGFAGHDVMDCDAQGLNEASVELAKHGTTSWVATTLTQPADQIKAACAAVCEAVEAREDGFVGANIDGIYLEDQD
ncbi:MAG: amidohydrolase family protein, partial [Atopobium minutum]|nr:amidohydrolase family protein [Atopobium minutum]